MEETLQYRTCDHLKEDGIYCGSPALHGRNYCYYHLSLRGRRLARAQARRRGEPYRLQLPMLENLYAVQTTLHEVLQSLADGQLDTRTAGLMLYGLQQAAANLNNKHWDGECRELDFVEPGRAVEYPRFEEKFAIPHGVDLDAEPEEALQQAEAHPESLLASQSRPAPPQQPRPGLRINHRHSLTAFDSDHEPTFEELQAQLEFVQGVLRRNPDEKRPPSSVGTTSEAITESA